MAESAQFVRSGQADLALGLDGGKVGLGLQPARDVLAVGGILALHPFAGPRPVAELPRAAV